jgi:hypothetical protein
MHYKFNNSDTETDTSFLQHATLWGPDGDDDEEVEPSENDDWDEAEEYIDDPGEKEDEDDQREIQVDDDLGEPDLDERFPEEEEGD